MTKAENETIITLNAKDMEEGFFRFGTSNKFHYQRMKRRLGGDYELRSTWCDPNKHIVWWECRIPVKYFSRTHFGLKRRGKRICKVS